MPQPSSHYSTANSLRLHYLESGAPDPNTPPILLLHGFPTSSHLYRNILPELGKTHRAIAIDLPGYGLSDKPLDVAYDYDFYADTLDAFLDALGIRDTHLCVHDLGGPAGLYWALRHPGRVPKVIILNTLVYPETSWAVKLFLLAIKTPGLRDYIVSPKGIVGTMKLGVVHKDRLNREVLTPYTAPFEDPAARKALIKAGSGLGTAGLAKIAGELPGYPASIRLIYGENDRALPDIAKTMQRLQRDQPEAELTALPSCGHFLQEDEPQKVGQLIAEFLNSATPITDADQDTGVGPNPGPKTPPIPVDLTPARDPAAEVIHTFNAWAANDLDVPPAAVTHCTAQSLPTTPIGVMQLLPNAHRAFFDRAAGPAYQTLTFTPAQTTESYDPTADMLPEPTETPKGQHAQAIAKSYFQSRRIEVIQATGTDTASDLNISFQIALDPSTSLLFTFITGLSN
jgi:pimeloyl-ACP methyl ester carboxylesterase